MKISVLITTVLIVQVSSSSFFDLFHGAVQSVQNGFGKLLTDVVTDVKETVDCTILAVQQMLSLSEDATRRYYEKCGNGMNSTSTNGTSSAEGPVNEENLEKEIDEKINKTMAKVIDGYKPDEKIKELEKFLVKESEQLTDLNDLLKKEVKNLSEELDKDFKKINHNDTDSSVDKILHEIKVLEKKELNTRNSSEAKEIQHVMSEVLDRIDAIEATEATENVKLDEIVGDLQNKSNDDSISVLKQEIKEWKEEESRNLGELKKEVQEHETIFDRTKIEHECNHTQPVIFNLGMPKDPTARSLNSRETSSENITPFRFINGGDANNKPIISLDGNIPSNDTTQLVEPTKRLNSEIEPFTTTNSTMNQTITYDNKSHEAIKMYYVYDNSKEFDKNKSSDVLGNNDTEIIREIQRTNVEFISATQKSSNIDKINSTGTTGSSITTDVTTTEKVQPSAATSNETVTLANIESTVMRPPESNVTDTHLTSIPLFLYEGIISANTRIKSEELTTVRSIENTTATTKPNDTATPDLPKIDSTPVSKTIPPLTATEDKDNNTTVTTEPYKPLNSNLSTCPHVSETTTLGNEANYTITIEPSDVVTINLPVTDSASENIPLEELTTAGNKDYSTVTAEPIDTATKILTATDGLPTTENIPLEELTTAGTEDNSTVTAEPIDMPTKILPVIYGLPATENIPLEEFTTAGTEDNSTVTAEPIDMPTKILPVIYGLPATGNIPLEEFTTAGTEDNSTVTAEPIDTATKILPAIYGLPATKNIPLEEFTTAGTEDNSTVTAEPIDMPTKILPAIYGLPATKNIPLEEFTTAGTEDNSTVTAEPIDTATKILPAIYGLPATKNIPLEEFTTAGTEDNSTVTAEPIDTATKILPAIYGLPATENIPLEEFTTAGTEDNSTVTAEPIDMPTKILPAVYGLPATENIPLEEFTTAGTEDNSTVTAEPIDIATKILPATDSLPASENIALEEFTTAHDENNPTVNTELNDTVTSNQSMTDSLPTSEYTPHEEWTTVDNEDNSTLTTEADDTEVPTQSMTDSSPASENIILEELTTSGSVDNPEVTKELNDSVTSVVSVTDSSPVSQTIASDVTSAMPDEKESVLTTTSVNDSTAVIQNGTNIPNTSEDETTPCCKDFEETSKRNPIENSPPTEIPELATVTTTQTSGTTLTTQIPTLRARVVDNKNALFDYDSLFPSQTNKEVRKRAIKEARQLMNKRKRSERIINNIFKNKLKGTVSLFSGPVPINSGK